MIYWHRRFILAYENMLRSLEPRFACITIPYWDYFADFAKKMNNLCSTFEGCSTFLSEFGGSTAPVANISLNNIWVNGTCNNSSMISRYCQQMTPGGPQTCTCVPRGEWAVKGFPAGYGYGTLAKILSGSYGFAWFSQNVHYSFHNPIHNTANGSMATLATSADPIFYSHHSTTDLVHQLFYDCQVGRPMTENEKKTSGYAFQPYGLTTSDISPTALSNITQDWQGQSLPKIMAEDHPLLSPFFSPLPNQYWQWVSGTDLGNNSYTYEKDALFAILQNNGISCPQNRARRLAVTRIPPTGDMRTRSVIKAFNLFSTVFNDALAVEQNRFAAFEQVELMECAYYHYMFGSVDDLSDNFKRNFGLPDTAHTTCWQRINELRMGVKRIIVSNWLYTFMQHLQ
ncbi:hypothetical protein Poli38472_009459 [Pythium oligandrum]|uniref:Tyrosinase copper-binding domain-containing protein n=1 Tax=Pythium oligandrum TaxID=41045 RepID=A0A8K1FGS2_PYTOL|nr:hypothetical protein Poli38472_009459 [Pythium oligandrum]|eukprot:TMW61966.1 hypothetical protein Poli38472_009459 [Pythium oligandrum]